MITLTADQMVARQAFAEFMTDRSRLIFTLAGFAGTGKTTLAHILIEDTKISTTHVAVAAPSAKAALVLQSKGFPSACTLHRLCCKRVRCEDPLSHGFGCRCSKKTRFVFKPRSDFIGVRLIVVDEVSMVDDKMANYLASLGIKILAMGDPFQLPPPSGRKSWFEIFQLNVFLEEVCRQAKESPVLWLATEIRERKHLPRGSFGTSAVVQQGYEPWIDHLSVPIIAGRNETRLDVNSRIRLQWGIHTWMPCVGDVIIGRRNHYEMGVLNGELYRVLGVTETQNSERLMLDLQPINATVAEYDPPMCIEAWAAPFAGAAGESSVRLLDDDIRSESCELNYGYVITAHSAQGSEWDMVLVLDESGCFKRNNQQWQWLYTAVTRAINHVVVIANYWHPRGSK